MTTPDRLADMIATEAAEAGMQTGLGAQSEASAFRDSPQHPTPVLAWLRTASAGIYYQKVLVPGSVPRNRKAIFAHLKPEDGARAELLYVERTPVEMSSPEVDRCREWLMVRRPNCLYSSNVWCASTCGQSGIPVVVPTVVMDPGLRPLLIWWNEIPVLTGGAETHIPYRDRIEERQREISFCISSGFIVAVRHRQQFDVMEWFEDVIQRWERDGN